MRSGERLPTLTADQKKQFGPFVSDYAVIYGYSQQVSQAMDAGLRPVGRQRERDSRPRTISPSVNRCVRQTARSAY